MNKFLLPCVICCHFKIGDKVKTPFGEGEVWKTTEKSVDVRHWNKKNEHWMYSKYLAEPWHHTQNSVTVISHCN